VCTHNCTETNERTNEHLTNAQWLKDRAPRQLAALATGIDAACVILRIAATKNVHLRAVNEDAIGAAIALARAHLTKNLIPSLMPPPQKTGLGAKSSHGEVGPSSSPASSGRNKSAATGAGANGGLAAAAARELAKVHRIVLSSTVDAYLKLIERTDRVVRAVPLEEQQVLMLTSGAMRALELDALAAPANHHVHALQVSTVTLLTSVFRHFPHQRANLIEDLFVLLPRISNTKRAVRSALIRYASVECSDGFAAWNAALGAGGSGTAAAAPAIPRGMQMFTALLLSLLLGVVERPAYVEPGKDGKEPNESADAKGPGDDEDDDDEDDDDNHDSGGHSNKAGSAAFPTPTGGTEDSSTAVEFRSGLGALHLWADAICVQLLKRVKMSKGDRDYRPLLSNLVEDLLVVWTIPEYSVAEALLLALVRRLTMDISQKSPQCLKALNSPMEHAESIETTYLNAAFDQLGRIAAAQARLLRENREAPLWPTPTHNAHGRTRPDPGKCYCGGAKTEKFEVKCDGCRAQYHGSCVGMRREAMADDWYCDSCRLARMLDRSSVVLGPHSSSNGASTLLDGTYALQHSYVSQLSHREGLPTVRAATRYHLARWAEHLATSDRGGAADDDDGTRQRPLTTPRRFRKG
jgi:PHD-finger